MSANVPVNPIPIGRAGIVNAAPVRGPDWLQIANAYDELSGMPSALVPMSMCYLPIPKTTIFNIPMRVWPRRSATHRIWFLSVGFTTANQTANIIFRDPSLTQHYFQVSSLGSPSVGQGRLVIAPEKITSRTSGEVQLTPYIYSDSSAYLFGLGCYEVRRPEIALGGNPITVDGGMDTAIVRSQLPICDGYQGDGVGYVARETDYLRDVARRPGLWAWFGQVTTSSSSFSQVFNAQPCALARGLHQGETQRVIQVAAYAAASAAGGGEIQWSMMSGASVTMPVPYTADGGYALVRAEFPVDAEDVTASDGRRSSRNDLCTVSFRAIAGTITLYSLTAGEGVFSDPASRAPSVTTIGARHLHRFGVAPLTRFKGVRTKFATFNSATPSLDLSSGGTFARALAAFYSLSAPTDGSVAYLATASSGVRRAADTRGDGIGPSLLMECTRKNYVVTSRNMTGAGWTAGSGQAFPASGLNGPDGAAAAMEATLSAGGYGNYFTTTSADFVSAQIVGTAYQRKPGGGTNGELELLNGDVSSHATAHLTLGSVYGRIEATINMTAFRADPYLAPVSSYPAWGGDGVALDVITDLAQLEIGYYPTSPIVTTGAAVTRPADTLSYATGAFPSGFLTSGVVVNFAPDAASSEIVSANEDWRLVQVGASDYLRIRNNAGSCVVDLVCGGTVRATATVTFSRGQLLTITAKPLAGSLTIAGATTGNGTTTGTGAAWPGSTTLYVGGDNAGANNATGRYQGASISQAA